MRNIKSLAVAVAIVLLTACTSTAYEDFKNRATCALVEQDLAFLEAKRDQLPLAQQTLAQSVEAELKADCMNTSALFILEYILAPLREGGKEVKEENNDGN